MASGEGLSEDPGLKSELDSVFQQFYDDLNPYILEDVQEKRAGISQSKLPQYEPQDFAQSDSFATITELEWKGQVCVGKKLSIELTRPPEEMKEKLTNFYKEIELLSELHHDNVVKFFGLYHKSSGKLSLPVLVMEKMEMNLAQCIQKYEPGCVPRSVGILCDVAKGLLYLHVHSCLLAHRDLTSSNILLTSEFHAKIADFRSARHLDMQGISSGQASCPRTPEFMPPEALKDPPHFTVAVDVFSFGCVTIHLFSGQWPSPADATDSEGEKINGFQLRKKWISMMGDSHWLIPIIKLCLEDDMDKRPTSNELLYLLQKPIQWSKLNEEFAEHEANFCNTLVDVQDLLPHLVAENVITDDEACDIKTPSTISEKVQALLAHITGPLMVGDTKPFYAMLEIMERHGCPTTQQFGNRLRGLFPAFYDQGIAPDELDESLCSAALRNIKDHYFPLQFCSIAPILRKLHSFEVITDHQKDVIEAKELESDQMKYFLDEVIIPSLTANDSGKFEYFIKVMKESDNSIDNIWAEVLGRYLRRIDSIQLLSTLEKFTTDDLEDDDADENAIQMTVDLDALSASADLPAPLKKRNIIVFGKRGHGISSLVQNVITKSYSHHINYGRSVTSAQVQGAFQIDDEEIQCNFTEIEYTSWTDCLSVVQHIAIAINMMRQLNLFVFVVKSGGLSFIEEKVFLLIRLFKKLRKISVLFITIDETKDDRACDKIVRSYKHTSPWSRLDSINVIALQCMKNDCHCTQEDANQGMHKDVSKLRQIIRESMLVVPASAVLSRAQRVLRETQLSIRY